MKVYVTFEYVQHEGIGWIRGVFDSKEKAEEFIKQSEMYDFEEWNVE